MPIENVSRYRVKQTSAGPVRLAFRGNTVIEAKNLKTGKVHTPEEFKAEKRRGRRSGHAKKR